jgi:hypothetical protein
MSEVPLCVVCIPSDWGQVHFVLIIAYMLHCQGYGVSTLVGGRERGGAGRKLRRSGSQAGCVPSCCG